MNSPVIASMLMMPPPVVMVSAGIKRRLIHDECGVFEIDDDLGTPLSQEERRLAYRFGHEPFSWEEGGE